MNALISQGFLLFLPKDQTLSYTIRPCNKHRLRSKTLYLSIDLSGLNR